MRIYLPEIKAKHGAAVDYSFQVELADCFADFNEDGSLKLLISASCSGDQVMISGSLAASAAAVCSRCLEAFNHRFSCDFTETFTVISNLPPGEPPHELAAETANMLTISGDYLYLDEYIRQLVILAQEYNPLCRTDCKGICAGCGADLNNATCCCRDDQNHPDVRLLKLKELRSGN